MEGSVSLLACLVDFGTAFKQELSNPYMTLLTGVTERSESSLLACVIDIGTAFKQDLNNIYMT